MKHFYKVFAMICLLQSSISFANDAQYTVSPQTVETSVQVMGQWMPLTVMPIRAPVSARIKKIHFAYGQFVEKGTALFELENEGLALDIEQASLEVIKQQQLCHQLEHWSTSEPLIQAKRDLELANGDYQAKIEHLNNTKKLVELGGVAKESLAQEEIYVERAQQQVSIAASRYEDIKQKGNDYALASAKIILAKQSQALETLKYQAQGLIQRAQSSGILYPPHLFSQGEKHPIQVDETVQAKQWLGVIASSQDYGIVLTLDDSWMDKLEEAKQIQAHVHDQDIQAHIESIEPIQMASQNKQKPQYQVTLKLEHRPVKTLRLGHKVSIKLVRQYSEVIAIPRQAISWQTDGAYVQNYHPKSQKYLPKKIILGQVGEDWAQVVEGLEQGDIIGFKA